MSANIDFGAKIKNLIERHGDTYEEAAKKVGSNRSTVNRWTRQKDVDTRVLKQLCTGYKITMSYFLSESANYTQSQNQINGGINAQGEKIMQYQNLGNNEGQSIKESADYKILIERLKSCEEKNALLEKIVGIYEKK